MSGTIARCNMCTDDDTRFRVPWDEIGIELMRAHLKDVHGHVAPERKPRIGEVL